MSRRKRGGASGRDPKNAGRASAPVPASDIADLEAAAEMLEEAVLRETETLREEASLREEEAMRRAEESLAESLDSGIVEANVADDGDAAQVRMNSDEDAHAVGLADGPMGQHAGAAGIPGAGEPAETAEASGDSNEDLGEDPVETRDPYAVLADYERRSFAHVVASADQVQAPGLWRGIAFRVGTRRLMSSITEVSEILPVLHHTSVPGTQPWLLGVVNVRGNLVPLVDLRGYIEGERTPLGDTSRMLVARHGSNAIGLLVEEVLGQRNLTAENDPLRLENDAANWARFVPAHFDLDGKLWGVFSMAALVAAPDFLHAAA